MSDSDEKKSEEKDSKKDTAELFRSVIKSNNAPSGNSASMNRSGRNGGNSFTSGRGCGRSAGRKRQNLELFIAVTGLIPCHFIFFCIYEYGFDKQQIVGADNNPRRYINIYVL